MSAIIIQKKREKKERAETRTRDELLLERTRNKTEGDSSFHIRQMISIIEATDKDGHDAPYYTPVSGVGPALSS